MNSYRLSSVLKLIHKRKRNNQISFSFNFSSTSSNSTTTTSPTTSFTPPITTTTTSFQSSISNDIKIQDRIVTIPNFLTLVRMILLAPTAGWLITSGNFSTAAYVVAAAGVLDALDGWVARTFDQRSVLGSYLDPAADKILLVTCFITLGSQGVIPEWLVTLVVARDVGLVIGTSYMIYLRRSKTSVRKEEENERDGNTIQRKEEENDDDRGSFRRLKPSIVSKINTALQILLVCCGLSSAAWNLPPAPRQDVATFLHWNWKHKEGEKEKKEEDNTNTNNCLYSLLLPTLATSVAVTTFASGLDYLLVAARIMKSIR
jgi:cardiolipin synthase (CMP-forming)